MRTYVPVEPKCTHVTECELVWSSADVMRAVDGGTECVCVGTEIPIYIHNDMDVYLDTMVLSSMASLEYIRQKYKRNTHLQKGF